MFGFVKVYFYTLLTCHIYIERVIGCSNHLQIRGQNPVLVLWKNAFLLLAKTNMKSVKSSHYQAIVSIQQTPNE